MGETISVSTLPLRTEFDTKLEGQQVLRAWPLESWRQIPALSLSIIITWGKVVQLFCRSVLSPSDRGGYEDDLNVQMKEIEAAGTIPRFCR